MEGIYRDYQGKVYWLTTLEEAATGLLQREFVCQDLSLRETSTCLE